MTNKKHFSLHLSQNMFRIPLQTSTQIRTSQDITNKNNHLNIFAPLFIEYKQLPRCTCIHPYSFSSFDFEVAISQDSFFICLWSKSAYRFTTLELFAAFGSQQQPNTFHFKDLFLFSEVIGSVGFCNTVHGSSIFVRLIELEIQPTMCIGNCSLWLSLMLGVLKPVQILGSTLHSAFQPWKKRKREIN